MSTAKFTKQICDRCAAVECIPEGCESAWVWGWIRSQLDDGGSAGADICPDCTTAFVRWWDQGKVQVAAPIVHSTRIEVEGTDYPMGGKPTWEQKRDG